jgi:hypothetical protein
LRECTEKRINKQRKLKLSYKSRAENMEKFEVSEKKRKERGNTKKIQSGDKRERAERLKEYTIIYRYQPTK